jgi:hypothetical protein
MAAEKNDDSNNFSSAKLAVLDPFFMDFFEFVVVAKEKNRVS